eukprot:scaffold25305_cov67-Phaeocystis_antarctica.AAC.6
MPRPPSNAAFEPAHTAAGAPVASASARHHGMDSIALTITTPRTPSRALKSRQGGQRPVFAYPSRAAEGPVPRAVGWSGFLYVHSPPPELGLQNARKFQRHTTTYDTEFHLVRRLLSDRQARTLWRDAASLFLVPTWAVQSWGNTGSRSNGISIGRLSRWVRQTHGEAHWDNGSRFLFGFFGDKGACHLRDKGVSGDKGKLGNRRCARPLKLARALEPPDAGRR